MSATDMHDPQRDGDKSPVSDTFNSQRPPRPLKYTPALPHVRFILLSVATVLVLVVAGVTVFVNQIATHSNLALVATKTLIPTSTPIHTPTPTPIPTPTPLPTATPLPRPTSNPILIPTSPPVPTPTPTLVVPTCAGSACDGKNPRNDHGPHGVPCWNDSAYVVTSQLVKYGVVYLWYSTGCGTNWAETLQTGGTSYIENANITRSSDNKHFDATAYVSDIWTVMVYASNTTADACGSINNATGGCSGFR